MGQLAQSCANTRGRQRGIRGREESEAGTLFSGSLYQRAPEWKDLISGNQHYMGLSLS